MKLNRWVLAFMVVVHGLALAALVRPIAPLWIPLALFVYFGVGFGTTLGLHRLLSHRSFRCSKWLEYLLVSVAATTGQGSPLLWVANHRRHHTHADVERDVHSPTRGFWYAHLGWILDERSTEPEAYRTVCRDFATDRYYHWLMRYRIVPHLLAVLGVGLSLGWAAVPFVFYLPMVCWMHSTYLVNSACHFGPFGFRSFETPDLSRNVWWVGLLALGEGWHNNHHASPRAAIHGFSRRQLDLSGLLLKLLERLGLVWGLRGCEPSKRFSRVRGLDATGEPEALDVGSSRA